MFLLRQQPPSKTRETTTMTRSSPYSSRERNQKTRKKRTKKYRFARRSRREDHSRSGPSSKLWRNETGDGVLFRAHHQNRKARCHSRERGRSFQSTRPSSSRVRRTTTPSHARHSSIYGARGNACCSFGKTSLFFFFYSKGGGGGERK